MRHAEIEDTAKASDDSDDTVLRSAATPRLSAERGKWRTAVLLRRFREEAQGLLLGADRSISAAKSGCAGTPGWCISSITAGSRLPFTCGTSKAASARTDEHIAREKISGLEKGVAYLLNKAGAIGDADARSGPKRW